MLKNGSVRYEAICCVISLLFFVEARQAGDGGCARVDGFAGLRPIA